ncbi:MAG: flagellar hook-length control protein FliK [Thiomonas sp.]|uniref:flagellar hook-length control protein FliK n=1 Tax=Thiomonas sp. TaxID=2047785 RepID=UPI002A366183|nr:flagellar hook-length control protein FliK [Thiomonas sp.]MDY0331357.1 flagellar hook-length control protein FliK [Thiomonas sp.]
MPLIVPAVSTAAASPAESSSSGAATSQSESGPRFADALSRADKAAQPTEPSAAAPARPSTAQQTADAPSSKTQAQGKADAAQTLQGAPSQDPAAANATAAAQTLSTSGALQAAMAASQSGKVLPQDARKADSKDAPSATPPAAPGSVLAAMLQAPLAAPAAVADKQAQALPASTARVAAQDLPLPHGQAISARTEASAGSVARKGAESLPVWMQSLAGHGADTAQPSRFAAVQQAIATASGLSAPSTSPSNHADSNSSQSAATPAPVAQALTLGLPQTRAAAQPTWVSTVSAHMSAPDWGQAMNQQVLLAAQGQQQFATLHLNPPQLGPLEVHLQMHDGQVQAQFVSAHAVVRQAVEAALPQLRDVFAGAGLSLGQTSVGAQGGQGEHQRARAQRGTSGSGAMGDIAAVSSPGASALPVVRWQQGLVNTYV